MRSVQATQEDIELYKALYGDQEVMKLFHDGLPKSAEYIEGRIRNTWADRWKNGLCCSALAVFDKKTNAFLGNVNMGPGDHEKTVEIAYLFHKHCWGKGYGKEAVLAFVGDYIPAAMEEAYRLPDGSFIEKIVATARVDNEASKKILQAAKMKIEETTERYGALRHHYSINATSLPSMTLRTPPSEKGKKQEVVHK